MCQITLCVSVQCFSSVVGPNGSGKSNVIDAMLFVFGKKAKQVRFLTVHPFYDLRPLLFLFHSSKQVEGWHQC